MDQAERCSQRVLGEGRWAAFNTHQCSKKAVVERNGKKFCTIHDPERVKAVRDKNEAKWAEESRRRQAKWEWESAAKALCSGVDTETMKRLGNGWLAKVLAETKQ